MLVTHLWHYRIPDRGPSWAARWQSDNYPLHDSRWRSRNIFGCAAFVTVSGQLKVEALLSHTDQCGIGGSAVEIHLRGVAERKGGGSRLFRPAHREGAGREARRDGRLGIRAYGLWRGDQ